MIDIAVTDFIIVFLIFLRILSTMLAAPLLGNKALPALSKIFIAFTVALIVFFANGEGSFVIEMNAWFLFSNAIKEIIMGLIIGFSLNIIFYGISFAGSIMSFDIGLSIAQVFNPVDETQADVIQNIIYFFALLIFLLIDGHHYLIRAISYSFSVVPIGNFKTTKSLFDLIIGYSSSMFVIAVKIASPILVTFFLINIGEGILARIIPQMQVFFVTQPLKIGIGLTVLIMTTPIYFYVIKNLLKLYEEKLFTLVQSIG